MAIIRTERSRVLWAPETTFGTMVTPTRRFGIHDSLIAPDPEYKWTPFYGVGSVSRNRDTILRGPQSLIGSVPDIRLQSTSDLSYMMAQILGYRFVSGPVAFVVESDFSAIGQYDGRIPSMTMQVAYSDTNNAYPLIRNFVGGKINRASVSANEGEEARLSLEEMMFLEERHNRSGVFGYSSGVTLATDPGISDAGRFIFSGANITFGGMTVCRARKLSLSIDNQLEYRYYLCTTGADGGSRDQLPTDIIEGKRVYKLDLDVDLGDPSTDLEFFDFLRMQGAASTSSKTIGLNVTATFFSQPSEGGGTLNLIMGISPNSVHPAAVVTSAKHNIPAPPAGLIPVTISLDVNSVQMTMNV